MAIKLVKNSSSTTPLKPEDFNRNMRLIETSLNAVESSLTGLVSSLNGDKAYVHNQQVASDTWVISHTLAKYPSVVVIDSAGTVVIGEVQYLSNSLVQCTFIGSFAGKAFLN